jgi:DNA-binding response OmpR family regulator
MDTCVIRRVWIAIDPLGPARAERTVLLVTGDADLRAAAERAITAAGYRVLAAAHSGHALLACMGQGTVDTLVTELAMDDMSGPSLAERLRRHHPNLQTVYLANAGTSECEGVLVRPFTRDDLLARIEAAALARL